jgi:methylenetetrahydrofolate dehydrogenase (NADP+)/methenyltetrahydrofolate cyclohydrolase
MNKIIDGKALSAEILERVRRDVLNLPDGPFLKIILVGNDPASEIYVKSKVKACEKVGIKCEISKYEDNVSENFLSAEIKKFNDGSQITAILVQLPLPGHINVDLLLNYIDTKKDVDGLNSENKNIVPATAKAVMYALEYTKINIKGKNCVVLGRSRLVGKPVAELLEKTGGNVTVCNSKTPDISVFTKKADILVSAVGKKDLVRKEMVKEGVVVIDVGINRFDGKIFGDVSEGVYEKASFYTPVPGGIGPMTVACLLENVIECAKIRV